MLSVRRILIRNIYYSLRASWYSYIHSSVFCIRRTDFRVVLSSPSPPSRNDPCCCRLRGLSAYSVAVDESPRYSHKLVHIYNPCCVSLQLAITRYGDTLSDLHHLWIIGLKFTSSFCSINQVFFICPHLGPSWWHLYKGSLPTLDVECTGCLYKDMKLVGFHGANLCLLSVLFPLPGDRGSSVS